MCESDKKSKKCSGCKKEFDLSFFSRKKDTEEYFSRCDNCLRAKREKTNNSNILWISFPELKEVCEGYKDHPRLTVISTKVITFKCPCGIEKSCSPKSLLEKPFCECGESFIKSKLFKDNQTLIKSTANLVLSSKSYSDFTDKIKLYSNKDKGDIYEVFGKFYFESHKKHYNIKQYYSKLIDQIPEEWNSKDLGSDGIILHNDDELSFVQVKFRSNISATLQRYMLGGSAIEALSMKEKFKHLFLFGNVLSKITNIDKDEQKFIKYILYSELVNCDWNSIKDIASSFLGKKKKEKEVTPLYGWQIQAIEFINKDSDDSLNFGRKTIISPTGSGKSTVASTKINTRITNKYAYEKVLVLCPNLHLLSQYAEQLIAENNTRDYLFVGSDLDVGEDEKGDCPYILTTDTETIRNFIYLKNEEERKNGFIIVSTYQSLDKILAIDSVWFDLTIADEAHKTITNNKKDSNFRAVQKRSFPSTNILFFTATPKVYKSIHSEECVDMNNEKIYGSKYVYTFKKAIEDGIISDYGLSVGIGKGKNNEMFDSYYLCESIKKYNLKSVLVCSPNHKKSRELYQTVKNNISGFGLNHKLILMKEGASSSEKNRAVVEVESGTPCIIFQVRIFSLGSDLPALQSVMLLGERSSVIDVVQTVGRVLRKHKDKEKAYVLIPCLLDDELGWECDDYKNVRTIVRNIGTSDGELIESIILEKRTKQQGKRSIDVMKIKNFENREYIYQEEEDEKEEIDFRIELIDRLVDERGIHTQLLLWEFIAFVNGNGWAPRCSGGGKNGRRLYRFFINLKRGNHYKNSDELLKTIFENVEEKYHHLLTDQLERKGVKRIRAADYPMKRTEGCIKFSKKINRLPKSNPKDEEERKHARFIHDVLSGRKYKSHTDRILSHIMDDFSGSLKEEFQKRIEKNRNRIRIKRVIKSPLERLKDLFEFFDLNEELPKRGSPNREERLLYCFLRDFIRKENSYKKHREEMNKMIQENPLANRLITGCRERLQQE